MEKLELLDVMMTAITNALADTHTATIAKVSKVNANTINCIPVINREVDGESIPLPEFVEVPVLFMQGGTSYTAYPIAVGNYCLLIFTERCFDRWWIGQNFESPLELRMHDYSDGIAIVGVKPLALGITIPTTIKQVGDTVQVGDYTHTGNMSRAGDTEMIGAVDITGDITQVGNTNQTGALTVSGQVQSGSLSVTGAVTIGGDAGVTGSFSTADVKTITVKNGIITGIA